MYRGNRIKNVIYGLLSSFLVVLSFIQPVHAILNLPKGRESEFSENNIVFYNPNGKNTIIVLAQIVTAKLVMGLM